MIEKIIGLLRRGKKIEPLEPLTETEVIAIRIAKAFLRGELQSRDLNGHGISSMSVLCDEKLVEVSWYSLCGTPRTLSIDGNNSFPEGASARIIFDAAIKRARRLIDEDMMRLMGDIK